MRSLLACVGLLLPAVVYAEEPLTLEQAIELAVTRSEIVEASEARAVAAEARVARARAFFFPELAAQGVYTRRMNETVRQVGDASVVLQRRDALSANATLDWALFDARGIPLYRAAARERNAAKLEAREQRRLFGFETADAFLTTLSTEQVVEAASRRAELAGQQLREARARVEAQLTSSNDVTRAQLELASAQRELTRARGEAETTRLQLSYLIQAPLDRPLLTPEPLLETAAGTPVTSRDEELTEILERRFDVAARSERVSAAQIFAQEPLFRLIPVLGLTAQYRLTNEGGLTGRTGDGFAALDLTWVLFDGGERYAERDERVALARATALDARALDRQVPLELATARVNLANAQSALQQAQVAMQSAQQNSQELQVLYRQGLARAIDLADANVSLFEAQVALARERLALGLAFLDLRAALGLDPLGREL